MSCVSFFKQLFVVLPLEANIGHVALLAIRSMSATTWQQLWLKGFPNFQAIAGELQNAADMPAPKYEVCLPLPNGDLAIQQSLIDLWTTKRAMFERETSELVAQHNEKYNPRGIKRGLDSAEGPETSGQQPETKKIRIEESMKTSEHEANIADKQLESTGNNFNHCLDIEHVLDVG